MKAIIKFNGGVGALLCNKCRIIIAYGTKHDKDKRHYCQQCEAARPWKALLRKFLEKEYDDDDFTGPHGVPA